MGFKVDNKELAPIPPFDVTLCEITAFWNHDFRKVCSFSPPYLQNNCLRVSRIVLIEPVKLCLNFESPHDYFINDRLSIVGYKFEENGSGGSWHRTFSINLRLVPFIPRFHNYSGDHENN